MHAPDLLGANERMFEEFCKRTNVQIDAEYERPQPQAVFT